MVRKRRCRSEPEYIKANTAGDGGEESCIHLGVCREHSMTKQGLLRGHVLHPDFFSTNQTT